MLPNTLLPNRNKSYKVIMCLYYPYLHPIHTSTDTQVQWLNIPTIKGFNEREDRSSSYRLFPDAGSSGQPDGQRTTLKVMSCTASGQQHSCLTCVASRQSFRASTSCWPCHVSSTCTSSRHKANDGNLTVWWLFHIPLTCLALLVCGQRIRTSTTC